MLPPEVPAEKLAAKPPAVAESAKNSAGFQALKEKLVEICGLGPAVGKRVFPGGHFGKTLAGLREMDAKPEELDRFVRWWREQAMSFRRDVPPLEQVARHFHESRPACDPEPESDFGFLDQQTSPDSAGTSESGEEPPETDEQRDASLAKYSRPAIRLMIGGEFDMALEDGDETRMEAAIARYRRWFPDESLPQRMEAA